MASLRPDPTFYPSAAMAMHAPPEQLAYVAVINPNPQKDGRPDALAVVDVNPKSADYAKIVGRVDMPNPGDEATDPPPHPDH